jgi:hypothetical protein
MTRPDYPSVDAAVRDLDLMVASMATLLRDHDEFVEALCEMIPAELLEDDSDEGFDPEAVILDYFRAWLGEGAGDERRRVLPRLSSQSRIFLAGRMSWNVSAIYDQGWRAGER